MKTGTNADTLVIFVVNNKISVKPRDLSLGNISENDRPTAQLKPKLLQIFHIPDLTVTPAFIVDELSVLTLWEKVVIPILSLPLIFVLGVKY